MEETNAYALHRQLKDETNKQSKKASHPTYITMLLESIHEQNSRNGVSRAKVVQYMKSKYKLEDVSAPALRKAVLSALEKGMIENKTGNGMNGKYSLTATQKLEFKKQKKKSAKSDSPSDIDEKVKPKPKSKPKPKTVTINEDTEETKTKTKKVSKGKENKLKWKKGDPIRKPSILKEKVALAKEKASRNLMNEDKDVGDDPIPSTSKQRMASNKGKTSKSNILM